MITSTPNARRMHHIEPPAHRAQLRPIVHHERDDDIIVQWLRDREVSCPTCRYTLRGIGHPTCPECGTRVELTLAAAPGRLGAWLAGVIAMAVVFGFSSIMLIAGLIGAIDGSWWNERDWVVLAALLGGVACSAVSLGIMLARRSRFVLRVPVEQWLRAVGAMVWAAVIQATVIAFIVAA